MDRWLVTGASGFLGVNLGSWLSSHVETIALSRGAPPSGVFDHAVHLDLTSGEPALSEVIAQWQPAVVVNAAALADVRMCEGEPKLAQAINVDTARDLARACAAHDINLIQISTDAVFDGTQGNYSEGDTPNPFSAYGESKLRGELAVAEELPAAMILRTNFFGWSPSGSRSILEFFVNALSSGSQVPGYTDFIVTSLYTQDLAKIIFELAGLNVRGLLHVASADPLSKFDFGREVAAAFGFDSALIRPAEGGVGPDGKSRARDISLNTSLLHSLLSANPPTQADGVRAALRDTVLRSRLKRPLQGDLSGAAP